MHDLRRAVLFAPDRNGPHADYRADHPDDRHPDNRAFVLMLEGRAIGTARLDRRDAETGVVRLVAIARDAQGSGHGRVLAGLIEAEAREMGMARLLVNAAPDALGYYRKLGWTEAEWDRAELCGIAAACVQMQKAL